jgi:hypothetical protein
MKFLKDSVLDFNINNSLRLRASAPLRFIFFEECQKNLIGVDCPSVHFLNEASRLLERCCSRRLQFFKSIWYGVTLRSPLAERTRDDSAKNLITSNQPELHKKSRQQRWRHIGYSKQSPPDPNTGLPARDARFFNYLDNADVNIVSSFVSNTDDPIRYSSTFRAHSLPSLIAQTTNDCPLRISPAVKIFCMFV